MPYKFKDAYELIGGLRLDISPTLMEPAFSPSMLNVRLSREEVTNRDGMDELGENLPLDSPVIGIRQFKSYDDTFHTVAFTLDDVYSLTEDLEWESIKGDIDWDAAEFDYSSSTFINDTLVFTVGSSNILEWDGSGDISKIDTSMDIKAKQVQSFMTRAVYANTIEDGAVVPQRVRWTGIGTYDDFDSGYAGFVDLVDTPGSIVRLQLLGESLAIYKEDSIVMCNYAGGKSVFNFDTRVSDIGLASPKGLIDIGDRHLFVANDNVYQFSGGRSVEPIGNAVQSEFPKAVSSGNIEHIWAERYGDEAWFFVPIEHDYPDTVFVYDWRNDRWYKHSMGLVSGTGRYLRVEDPTIGNFRGEIGELNGRIGDFGTVGIRPRITIGTEDGYIYNMTNSRNSDAGEAVENRFDTKDFTLSEEGYRGRYSRVVCIEFEAKGTNVDVYYSTDQGNSYELIDNVELNSRYEWYKLWFDKPTTVIRFRFVSEDNDVFSLKALRISYKEGGLS